RQLRDQWIAAEMWIADNVMFEKTPLLQNEQQARRVTGRVPAIIIMVAVEGANVGVCDAFVGADDRPHVAIEPYHGLLNGSPLCRARAAPSLENLAQGGAVGGREVQDFATPACKTIAHGP